MIILTLFAFLAGLVTILSPCIFPILPVILASSVTDTASRRRPYGIVTGFVLSFTFFTLFLSVLVKAFGVPAEILRTISIVVIAGFGVSLLSARVQKIIESLFSRLANLTPTTSGKGGFGGGVLIGLSLGLLWTPCVGPILASVISLAVAGTVTFSALILTFAYSLGTAIPMLMIIRGGQQLIAKVPWLSKNTVKIQKAFGVVMILTAIGIYAGVDRSFQTYFINKFPNYGTGLTKVEDNATVLSQLEDVTKPKISLGNKQSLAPELILGGKWFNLPKGTETRGLPLSDLKGKVVIVDFWTYTCINCQRTLPYLKAWYEKYHGQGLEIIGVHAPEFEFEKDPENVEKAIADFGIKYPVMQDNEFATWKAYQNHYWPAKYFIDKDGFVRYTHFGEGAYDESEKVIQELLKETGVEVSEELDTPTYQTYGRTPETYLGANRSDPSSGVKMVGTWTIGEEFASPPPNGELLMNFDAKNVYLVMRPEEGPTKVQVYLDGEMVKTVTVTEDGLYTLVELPTEGRHQLRLVFPDGKIELYAFTFG